MANENGDRSREWAKAAQAEADSPTRAIDRRLARVFSRQKQLATTDQLRECGLSGNGVRSRVQRGRLHRIYPTVFAAHPPPYSPDQLLLAAVRACGPGAMASDLSSAHLQRHTDRRPTMFHVSSAGSQGRRLPGIKLHRRSIARADFLIVRGIPCTGAARTILDCAGSLGITELEELLMAADASGMLNRRRLGELLAEGGGRGTKALRKLVADDPVDTRSENERRMLRICRRFGVTEPLVNHPIRTGNSTFIADFCWPRLRLIVEADSWRWHGGRHAGESDADRDQLLSLAGWRVVHFTRDQVKHRPDQTGRRLLALTGSGSSATPIGS